MVPKFQFCPSTIARLSKNGHTSRSHTNNWNDTPWYRPVHSPESWILILSLAVEGLNKLMFPAEFEASGGQRTTSRAAERVVVGVRADKAISKTALAWALTHVVHPGDGITLLAVFPAEKNGNSSASAISIKLNLSVIY